MRNRYLGSCKNYNVCQELFTLDNSTIALVKCLVNNIGRNSRNFIFDNSFTSISLSFEFFENYKLTIAETLKKNKKEILPQLNKIKKLCSENKLVWIYKKFYNNHLLNKEKHQTYIALTFYLP